MQGKAYTLATRLFPHSRNNKAAWMDRPRHCCASVAIGRTDDDVATPVPLHDFLSRGPSAPNQTDGRTPGHNNIYRASIAPRGKKMVCLCVGHPKSLKRGHSIEDNFLYIW